MSEESARINRILLNLAAFVVIVAGMRAASPLLVSFLVALFLAVLCATPLRWMVDHKIPKFAAVLSLVLAILAAGSLIGTLLGNRILELGRLGTQLDTAFAERVTAVDLAVSDWLRRLGIESPQTRVSDVISPSALLGLLRELVENLGIVLANGFLIILTMVFMLFEVSGVPAKLRAAFGEKDAKEAAEHLEKVGTSIRRYVAMKTLIGLGTGLTVTLVLSILGVHYPLLWGTLAFLLNYIPNIGSVIAAVPAVLVAWLQIGFGTAVVTSVGYLVVNVFWGNLVEPRLIGRRVGLSTLVVFCSLVFWGWVLGPVGMLLSVPLTVMCRIMLETSDSTRWLAVFLGSDRGDERAASSAADDGSPSAKRGWRRLWRPS